jgi:hypothetical protein
MQNKGTKISLRGPPEFQSCEGPEKSPLARNGGSLSKYGTAST